MRVCQPGPVAFQRSMTSTGRRNVRSLRALPEIGRPRFFTTIRASISAVRRGPSTYSCGLIECWSTRLRSDPKERREARFFAGIGFPHANDVTSSVTRRIDDLHKSASQQAETDDSRLSVVLARVLRFSRDSVEYLSGIRERARISVTTINGGSQPRPLRGEIRSNLTVELSGARAAVSAWHVIFHACTPAIC